MELCTARIISNLPHHTLFTANHTYLRSRTSLPLKPSILRTTSGLLYYTNSPLRATSEETSTGPSQYGGEEPRVITMEDVQLVEKNSYAEIVRNKEPNEDSSMDGQTQAFEFLDNLDIKLDSEDTYPILLFGGGALIALWLATAIVGAIDSIPLFPKLMKVVGLAYTLWFSTRYLIFKENRDELFAKIEEIKQQVLGSDDD